MKNWWNRITWAQKAWIILSTLAVAGLGYYSGDSWINIAIGTIGMAYVSVYASGARGAFLMGVVYVSIYTIICLQNRIMLDALQNIILIPIYIYSFIYWGKQNVTPRNLSKNATRFAIVTAVFMYAFLFLISKLLNGNYSALDALNTTCTLCAMVLGIYGASLTWVLWSVNNITSAITFGLALATPTGSMAVFCMKVVFVINGLIGWWTWYRNGKNGEEGKHLVQGNL